MADYNVKTAENSDPIQKGVFPSKLNPKWGREEESELFAQNVKRFRQKKLSEEDVSEVMTGLVEAGLTTREACGNTVRNVMCSHFAGVCPNEKFDATPYAKAIARFFIRNPMCQNLPRKFKINFGCCANHGLAQI